MWKKIFAQVFTKLNKVYTFAPALKECVGY